MDAVIVALTTAWALDWFGPPHASLEQDLAVDFRRYMGDYPSSLGDWPGGGGQLLTLWELTVTNRGPMADAITGYELRVLSGDGGHSKE